MNFKISNSFFCSFLCITTSAVLSAQVVVNEYSCSNINIINDNYGNTPDWIELYNTGASSVNLSGYHLSDKITNPSKWTIPTGVSISPHSYLLIWASGKNTVAGIDVHSNFTLTQTKPEAIIFTDASGVVIDSMTLKPTLTNHSRGRINDGSATWGVFTTPTPRLANTGAKTEYATRPAMSVNAGFYSSTQNITLSSPDPNITIHYTTNGSTPTLASTTYTTPISITNTTVLRARAFSSNVNVPTSFVSSNTYFINVNHVLPVVSLFGDQIETLLGGSQIDPQTGLEFFDKNKVQQAETEGESNEHGNDSWSYNQRGIDFISRDEMGYNYAINYKIFSSKSRKSFQRIIFKAAANDNYPSESDGAHIRDAFAQTLSQLGNLDLDERTCAFVIMYVDGQYWGVYDCREKVDDSDFTDYYYNQPDPPLQFLQTWGSTWSAYGGPQAAADWLTIRNYITTNNMAVQTNYNYVDSIFNIHSFVDYFVFNSWLVTSDWLNWNTAWWRGLNPAGTKKKWRYTLWDLDAILGHYINYTNIPNQTPLADPCNVEGLPNPGGQGHTEILNSLMANPDFKQYYRARYIDLMNTSLNCNFVLPIYDSMIALIQPEMQQHCTRWGGTYSVWQTNAANFRNAIQQRCNAMAQGLIGCYQLTGPYAITMDVQPVGAGNVQLNSIIPSSYIFSANYFGGIATLLKAYSNTGYVFDHWSFKHHTPTPSISEDTVSVTFTQADSVVAVFTKTDEPPPPPPPPVILEQAVAVPSAFSPNDDGVNDILYVSGTIENLEFAIYNRWGQEVFKTNDQSKGWDGTYKGQKLNNGVFAYRLSGKLLNGDSIERKGNITLVR